MASDLITLADAKDFLKITSSNSDARIQGFVDTANEVAQFYCGDLLSKSYTEYHDGGDRAIYTRHTPVQSVTSLSEYVGSITYTLTNQPLGQSVDAWGYTIDDPAAGRIVRRTASGLVWRFAPGVGNVTITYTTGVAAVPPQVMTAVEIIVKHLWATQRGAMPLPPQESDTESVVPGLGYAIPNRAIELLETVPRTPVVG
ncbi:MAG: head-tail connector protein [Frankiaceae bacterium]